ncbi:MAG: hypothetical protein M8860_07590 [marine benthic group bacterium]|jgi:hypothetical protein|nr:hypothetical protein [Gemmatimonadota bacterium]MCL7962698.1 hypothetical protein [Candidatus Carthagonibacter metallireducens]MCL7957219.1 hypothetical protein [Gemmatimonadota bacterium]MCL7965008.1 hypothetical protein [Gemmatimonadota bacterium]MCL7966964.1 hypothetical protein [Gemmatimonadota bacterium]
MGRKLKADGDVWIAVPGGSSGREGHRSVVFMCDSNGQRPYRVAEVQDDGSDAESHLANLEAREFRELFDRSTSLGTPAS